MPSTSTAPTTLPPTIVSVDRLGPPLACLCPGGRLVSTNYPHLPCPLPPLIYHQGGHTRPYLHSPHITIELRGQRTDWASLLNCSLRLYLRSPRAPMHTSPLGLGWTPVWIRPSPFTSNALHRTPAHASSRLRTPPHASARLRTPPGWCCHCRWGAGGLATLCGRQSRLGG